MWFKKVNPILVRRGELTSSSANIRPKVTIDGNEAAAYVAHQTNEVIAIYPITPSSNMGEWADQWSAEQKINIWGTVPTVIEMQSEGGAAGALHGALQTGSLGTTFTASQGLLLMIPNMFKIAGELTSSVIHVAARALATHALSIFGDHSDVMAVRATGFAMLSANSVQETMDMALISQAATLEARIPFIHFFDGFRTSHEVAKVEQLTSADMRAMIDEDLVRAHRERGLNPNRPVMRGTAQNPDVYFQAREACNPFYLATPTIVQNTMDKFAKIVGRQYHLFDYVGAPDAERIIVMMGSGAEVAEEAVDALVARGEKIGLLKVHLFRPFAVETFVAAMPASVKSIAVLDRTKEPGATGEPLYCDVVTALSEMGVSFQEGDRRPVRTVVEGIHSGHGEGGFRRAAKKSPKNHFTVGIHDDVTHTSLDYDPAFSTEVPGTVRALFYGLGADGTVGANKNSIKIIGEETDNFAQGYFVYDSKKSGAMTTSHLRFGPRPLHSSYLITNASFVACHQFSFLERFDVLKAAEPGATFLLNSTFGRTMFGTTCRAGAAADHRQEAEVLRHRWLRGRQEDRHGRTHQHHHADLLLRHQRSTSADEAIEAIKHSIKKTYGKRGESVVKKNFRRRGCRARSSP
jgi:pyruvate-ferredoxin/flavodoxin oxidoreductase